MYTHRHPQIHTHHRFSMYCPLRGSHSNQLCITSHTKEPFASSPFIPYSQKSTSCLNSSFFFLTPSLFIQFIAAAALPPQNKKKVYTEVYFGCCSMQNESIVSQNRLCDDISLYYPNILSLILLILIGNTTIRPPLNFYPIHIQNFSFSLLSVLILPRLLLLLPSPSSFYLEFSTSHPTNHPIYKCFLCIWNNSYYCQVQVILLFISTACCYFSAIICTDSVYGIGCCMQFYRKDK